MIILDTNALVQWMTVDEVHDDYARLTGLVQSARESGTPIGIPTPVFAEFLVRADDATAEFLAAVERRRGVRLLSFDKRAAHECALLDRYALASGDKRGGAKPQAWQKVKIDRQIVAIARVHSTQLIITNDDSLRSIAMRAGIECRKVVELPIPDDARQQTMFGTFNETPPDEESSTPPSSSD